MLTLLRHHSYFVPLAQPNVRVQHEQSLLEITMADPNKVYPTGLTLAEAEELHGYVINGTRTFGAIAVLAHVLAYAFTPWLH
jgi:light-harvesting protein B-800-850 beta chain